LLTGKQKRFLRSLGNEMEPILFVGKEEVTKNVIKQADEVLEAREFIKGRVLQNWIGRSCSGRVSPSNRSEFSAL